MKSYCEKCGNELKEGSKFCVKCGNPISTKKEQNISPDSIETEPIQADETIMEFCTNCGEEMTPEADFCIKCGVSKNKIHKYCIHCGSTVTAEQDFCIKCGTKISSNFSIGNIKISDGTQEQVDKFAKTTVGRAYINYWLKWNNYTEKATRPDFWYALLVCAIVYFILFIITAILSVIPLVGTIVSIIIVVFILINLAPVIALYIRRSNDAGLNWKWFILATVLSANLFLAILPSKE